jgi:hypothetical protein
MHWKPQIVECLNSMIMAPTGYISNVSHIFHMPSVIRHKNETVMGSLRTFGIWQDETSLEFVIIQLSLTRIKENSQQEF